LLGVPRASASNTVAITARMENAGMMISLDVNLRLPNVTVGSRNDGLQRITNTESRFWKTMEVAALPKVGDHLHLSCRSYDFWAVVKRVDWHDSRDRFVVACHYAKRPMTAAMYESFRADPGWTMRPLIPGKEDGDHAGLLP
jgi:hypothetical protein